MYLQYCMSEMKMVVITLLFSECCLRPSVHSIVPNFNVVEVNTLKLEGWPRLIPRLSSLLCMHV